jgi:hypothetical protein
MEVRVDFENRKEMKSPEFNSVEGYLASLDPTKERTLRSVIDFILTNSRKILGQICAPDHQGRSRAQSASGSSAGLRQSCGRCRALSIGVSFQTTGRCTRKYSQRLKRDCNLRFIKAEQTSTTI